jgi:two-component system, NarL family, nitrate/nitrite response regulator NarL
MTVANRGGGRFRILIADDHRIFRDGLRMLLAAERDFEVVGEAADGEEAARKVRDLRPDMLLLDVAMPEADGLHALEEIGRDQTTRTLLLTGAIEESALVTALQLGARGVVMKDAATSLLIKAIRGVMAGEFWVGRDRVPGIVEALRPLLEKERSSERNEFGLTDRELEIIAAIVAAYSNRDIATKLQISEKTVKRHLTNIFEKIGVSTRLELALFAMNKRLPLPALDPS